MVAAFKPQGPQTRRTTPETRKTHVSALTGRIIILPALLSMIMRFDSGFEPTALEH
jgi:hypothetical protein